MIQSGIDSTQCAAPGDDLFQITRLNQFVFEIRHVLRPVHDREMFCDRMVWIDIHHRSNNGPGGEGIIGRDFYNVV